MKKVAFQGEKGAFSEDAAYHYWGNNIVPLPCKYFRDVFESVTDGKADYGIIPVENSLTGSVHQNIDLLLEFDLSVLGEIILKIQHNLLILKKMALKEIKNIYSHPQALQQCSEFIESMKHCEIRSMDDTAGSARYIKERQKNDSAAIASLRAGREYGLQAIKKNIENNHQNFTRFLIVAKNPQIPARSAKTSVVFSVKDAPGALFKTLAVFALRDINLLKIESRPLQKGPWKYWFYLDFEGNMEEEKCKNAINHLQEITIFFKVLGSYPPGKVVK